MSNKYTPCREGGCAINAHGVKTLGREVELCAVSAVHSNIIDISY